MSCCMRSLTLESFFFGLELFLFGSTLSFSVSCLNSVCPRIDSGLGHFQHMILVSGPGIDANSFYLNALWSVSVVNVAVLVGPLVNITRCRCTGNGKR